MRIEVYAAHAERSRSTGHSAYPARERLSGTNPQDGDRLAIENGHGLLSLAGEAASPERNARLEQLRLLVAAGSYEIDARTLGSAIVETMLQE